MKKNEVSACEDVERRKVVKGIVGGIAAVTAYSLLPARWDTPLIESVFLPAHAATSGGNSNANDGSSNKQNRNIDGRWYLMDIETGEVYERDVYTFENGKFSGFDGYGTYSVVGNTVNIVNDSGFSLSYTISSDGNTLIPPPKPDGTGFYSAWRRG